MIKKTFRAIYDIFSKTTHYFKTLGNPQFTPAIKPLPRSFVFRILRSIYHAFPLPLKIKIKLRWYLNQIITFQERRKKMAEYLKIRSYLPTFTPLKKTSTLPDVFIFSVIDWTFRIQRPQHLATSLAEQGHRVFYISNNFINHTDSMFEAKQLSEKLPLYWISLSLEGSPAIYGAELPAKGLHQLIESITQLMLWAETSRLIALVQHPFWNELAFALPNCQVIYDCMDHHAGFNETSFLTLEKEKQLLKNAHLVLTSSQKLYEEASLVNASVALVRNATDYKHFSKKPVTVYQDKYHRKIIGYYGAIAEWFDDRLVDALATAFPEYCVLLIGNDTANVAQKLKHHKNIIFTGEAAYEKLPYYLYAFDICIIPFKVIPLTLATNPVKAYEYLSAGKPVVSIDLPELHEFSNLIKLADSSQKFISEVKNALENNSPQDIANRKNFASQQTWTSRATDIQKALEKIQEPLVSIIILTYNNLALTKTCLESIEKYTDYENIEIIIVDNASTDHTPDFLRQTYQYRSHYKIIFNKENLGFAAGNNVGLKTAAGEYLVLLNNDTRVTPGWLRTLINHFRQNPKLGLLGPITNNIGNEAKIHTKYKNPDYMFPEVYEIIYKNMGTVLPLKTIAFFCVMIPRIVFEKVGLLDESFGMGFFEDDDYCQRTLQAGYQVFCAEDVFIHHHLSASFDQVKIKTRQELFEKNKKIYEAKWGKWESHRYR